MVTDRGSSWIRILASCGVIRPFNWYDIDAMAWCELMRWTIASAERTEVANQLTLLINGVGKAPQHYIQMSFRVSLDMLAKSDDWANYWMACQCAWSQKFEPKMICDSALGIHNHKAVSVPWHSYYELVQSRCLLRLVLSHHSGNKFWLLLHKLSFLWCCWFGYCYQWSTEFLHFWRALIFLQPAFSSQPLPQ